MARYTKEPIDGFCECASCGKKIEGMQTYDNFFCEFICEECDKDKKKATLAMLGVK